MKLHHHHSIAWFAFASAAQAATVIGPTGTLVVSNVKLAPDGIMRSTTLVNSVFPAPLITGTPSSSFNLNVVNQLTDLSMHTGTSVHWHGLFQRNTTWSDGVSFVSQSPIASGNSFMYQFNAAGQAGTFWYHSHYSTQYCDGLRGPLVIYDKQNDPHLSLYDIDDETTVITLADWYHNVSAKVELPFLNDATLINGQGRAFNASLRTNTSLAVINVVQGKKYRLRIINIACDPNYIFSIDGHTFQVIEADGNSHKALTVDSLQIFAAQRYSVILNVNQTIGNYWIRSLPDSHTNFDGGPYAGGINSAILRYQGAPQIDPTTSIGNLSNTLKESDLVPVVNPAAPGPANLTDPSIHQVGFNITVDGALGTFAMNGTSFLPNVTSVPILLQILNGQIPPGLVQSGSVFALPRNKVIQVTLPLHGSSTIGTPHPFHLHGHSFSIVKGVGQTVPRFNPAPRRDVVNTGDGSEPVIIRFVTDNAGPWFLHCHIDWHLQAGLAIVFAEDIAGTPAANHPSPAWSSLAPQWSAHHDTPLGGGSGRL